MDMNNHRFLILQGEVEQISLMRPMTGKKEEPGLLEYLEDIIGSHRYVDQIADMSEKYFDLKKAKENEMLLLHDLRKDLDSMEDHKDRAIRYLEAEQRVMCLNHLILYFQLSENRERDYDIQVKIQKTEEEIEELKVGIENKLEYYRTDFKLLKKFETEKVLKKDMLIKLKLEMDQASKKDQELNSNIKLIIADSIETEKLVERNSLEMNKAIEENHKISLDLPKRETELIGVNRKLVELEKKEQDMLIKIAPQINQIKQEMALIDQSSAPLDREITNLNNSRKAAQQRIENIDNQFKKIRDDLERVQTDIHEQQRTVEKLSSKCESLKKEQDASKSSLTIMQSHMKELQEKEAPLAKDLKEVEMKLAERKQKQDEQIQKNVVLNYLLQSKELMGKVHGRIGDLGSIDPKYDIAISAVSMQFNCILVDNSDVAKLCLKLLKKDEVGIANLMILDKSLLFKPRMELPFQAPPNSLRLFDLVHTNNEDYRCAFYQILQDTLVCQNIDAAQRINQGLEPSKRYKIVTLEGFILNPDGTMSGGGRPRKGLVGTKIKAGGMDEEDNLELLIQRRDELSSQLKVINAEISSLKQAMNKCTQDTGKIPALVRVISEELDTESRKLADMEKKRDALNEELQNPAIQSSKTGVLKEIASYEREVKRVEQEQAKLIDRKKELQEKIIEHGGHEMRAVREQLDAIREEARKTESLVERIKADVKKNLRIVDEKRKENEELESKLKSWEKEKAAIIQKKAEIEEKFASFIEQEKDIEKEQAKLDKEFSYLSQKVSQFLTEIQSEKALLGQKHGRIDMMKKEKDTFKQDMTKITEEIENNRRQYLNFVSNFSIIEELKKMETPLEDEASNRTTAQVSQNKRTLKQQLIRDITPDREITREELAHLGVDMNVLKTELIDLKNEKLALSSDTEIIEVYKDRLLSYMKKNTEYTDVSEKEKIMRTELNNLKERRRLEFMTGFNFISKTLKHVYQIITNGGDAELELIDSYDPFSEGIMFSVRPPHKSWKQMSKLSGGEKTLSSLSLIFALHYYKPTPIYFMDEIDAALDFRNVEIVAKFIKERTKDAQFIVISLRNHMFELANQLVGIYKLNDTTKTIKIAPEIIVRGVQDMINRQEAEKKLNQHKAVDNSDSNQSVMLSSRKSHFDNLRRRLSRSSAVVDSKEPKELTE